MVAPRTWQNLFLRFITHRTVLVLAVVATVVISAVAEVGFPWLLQRGVDATVGEDTAWSLAEVAIGMAGVIVVIVLGHAASLLIEAWLFSGASFDLRRTLYSQFQHLPLADLARQSTGVLTHRATADVATFEAGMIELFSGLVFDVLVGLGVISAMVLVDWRLTAIVCAIILVATAVNGQVGRPLPSYTRATQMLAARLAGRLQESLGAARTVRAFNIEAREVALLDSINRRMRATERQAGIWRAIVTPLWHFAEGLGVVAVLWYGGSLVASKTISIGAMVGFMAYMELLAGPITRIGGYYAQFQTCRGLAQRIVDLFKDFSPIAPKGTQIGADIAIELRQVSFRYPGTERAVLHDVSFSIASGECVALVGRNGAGKSTVFDLLLRFCAPTNGAVVVGGIDLAAWDNAAWRATLGYMPQETVLFRGTLADNIALGDPSADHAAIAQALEDAGGGSLLRRLPQGLRTVVGERGQGLSGGERQLIGLARLFLHDPRIVLLDEPTAALDGEVVPQVIAALERLAQGRTMVLITHSPLVLKPASRVVLLDAGRVIASGTPEVLSATHSLYRALTGGGVSTPRV